MYQSFEKNILSFFHLFISMVRWFSRRFFLYACVWIRFVFNSAVCLFVCYVNDDKKLKQIIIIDTHTHQIHRQCDQNEKEKERKKIQIITGRFGLILVDSFNFSVSLFQARKKSVSILQEYSLCAVFVVVCNDAMTKGTINVENVISLVWFSFFLFSLFRFSVFLI